MYEKLRKNLDGLPFGIVEALIGNVVVGNLSIQGAEILGYEIMRQLVADCTLIDGDGI